MACNGSIYMQELHAIQQNFTYIEHHLIVKALGESIRSIHSYEQVESLFRLQAKRAYTQSVSI